MRDTFAKRFQFSRDHLGHLQIIARDAAVRVREATFEEDTREATDLVVFTTTNIPHPQTFACRVRDTDAREKWPRQFTIRYQMADGRPAEWHKIAAGFGDWMIYGFTDPARYGRLVQWVVLNLELFREVMHTVPKDIRQNPPHMGGNYLAAVDLDDVVNVLGLVQVQVRVPPPIRAPILADLFHQGDAP